MAAGEEGGATVITMQVRLCGHIPQPLSAQQRESLRSERPSLDLNRLLETEVMSYGSDDDFEEEKKEKGFLNKHSSELTSLDSFGAQVEQRSAGINRLSTIKRVFENFSVDIQKTCFHHLAEAIQTRRDLSESSNRKAYERLHLLDSTDPAAKISFNLKFALEDPYGLIEDDIVVYDSSDPFKNGPIP